MKKLVILVLLTVYGLSSTGMTLHLHYCCGRLDKIDLTPVEKNCSGKHTGKSCCDNKEISFRIQSDQNLATVAQPSVLFAIPAQANGEFLTAAPIITSHFSPEVFAPPPLSKNIQHLFCIYRI